MTEATHIQNPLAMAVIAKDTGGLEGYTVGNDGVTKIELVEKPGPGAMIPYVRVWREDVPVGEWAQHAIIGIYFAKDQAEIDQLVQSDPAKLLAAFRETGQAPSQVAG